jgi:class 3 adenylate cyclase
MRGASAVEDVQDAGGAPPPPSDEGGLCPIHQVWLTPEDRCPLCDGDQEAPRRVTRVCLFTDLVGSTELKRRLGELAAVRAIQRHNALFRDCLARFEGREENNLGDGFFATFEVPSNAISCALAFQQGLAELGGSERLHVRIGINMGEIPMPDAEGGPASLVSTEVDTAARMMGLAKEGQILMTRSAFDLARPVLTASPRGDKLEWKAHGLYELQGVEGAREVFEVGVAGVAPLLQPEGSAKARRIQAPGAEEPGWRPALGQAIPGRPAWRLEKKLGAGGFGEVWLAVHSELKHKHAFKFCFEAERVRVLRREGSLLKALKVALGDREDIAQVLDWQLREPPYFLELEFASEGSVIDWADGRGGLACVPLGDRLEIVAQAAEALAAAHNVGVLHRDVKPSNILVSSQHGRPRIRLADFGIGAIVNRELMEKAGLSVTALAHSLPDATGSSGSGTIRYMDPDVLNGHAPTVMSDIYSLGVVLFQMVTGDLKRGIGPGWEHAVEDELLREDILSCVTIRERRLDSAATLSRSLRRLEARRAERAAALESERRQAEARREQAALEERRQRRRQRGAQAATLLAAVGLATAIFRVVALDRAVTAATDTITELTAHWVAEMVEHELALAEIAVRQTAADPRTAACLEEDAGPACAAFLADVLERQRDTSHLRSVALADASGILRVRQPRKDQLVGRCFAYREWFHGVNVGCPAVEDDPNCGDAVLRAACPPLSYTHISAPFTSKSDQQEVFSISTPVIREKDGRTLGVLLASRTVMNLQEQIKTAQLPLRIMIVNDRDQLVVHPLRPPVGTRWELPASMRRQPNGVERSLADPVARERVSASFSQVGSRGWVVIVARGEALRDVARIAYRSGYVLVGLALAGALASLWLLGSSRRKQA